MNNRGKEILDEFLKENSAYSLRYSFNGDIVRDKDLFKDYLRELIKENEKLQEGNKKLKETISKIPRYKMEYELEIDKLKNELEELEKNHDFRVDQAHNLQKRINKAIEYLGINEEILETCGIYDVNGIEVYKILQGSDKE